MIFYLKASHGCRIFEIKGNVRTEILGVIRIPRMQGTISFEIMPNCEKPTLFYTKGIQCSINIVNPDKSSLTTSVVLDKNNPFVELGKKNVSTKPSVGSGRLDDLDNTNTLPDKTNTSPVEISYQQNNPLRDEFNIKTNYVSTALLTVCTFYILLSNK
ncbi:unnamed protein product [Gordionus sp. m RMFG-2023]